MLASLLVVPKAIHFKGELGKLEFLEFYYSTGFSLLEKNVKKPDSMFHCGVICHD